MPVTEFCGEAQLLQAADLFQLPVLFKGPTGCGNTRFIEHGIWQLKRESVSTLYRALGAQTLR